MTDPYLLAFLAVVSFVVVATIWAVEREPPQDRSRSAFAAHPRVVAIAWLGISAAPTLAGVYAPSGPVPPQAVMLAALALVAWFSVSRTAGEIARRVPLHLLVAFQGFRLPLEIVLHHWTETGVAPPQMTWTGSNIDILAGALALLSVPVVRSWRRAGWVPTAIGIVLLANVLWIVARSLPGPLLAFDDVVTLPDRFPHVWIATVCVTGAVGGHAIALRALLTTRHPRDARAA